MWSVAQYLLKSAGELFHSDTRVRFCPNSPQVPSQAKPSRATRRRLCVNGASVVTGVLQKPVASSEWNSVRTFSSLRRTVRCLNYSSWCIYVKSAGEVQSSSLHGIWTTCLSTLLLCKWHVQHVQKQAHCLNGTLISSDKTPSRSFSVLRTYGSLILGVRVPAQFSVNLRRALG